jgi:hypothetical protein
VDVLVRHGVRIFRERPPVNGVRRERRPLSKLFGHRLAEDRERSRLRRFRVPQPFHGILQLEFMFGPQVRPKLRFALSFPRARSESTMDAWHLPCARVAVGDRRAVRTALVALRKRRVVPDQCGDGLDGLFHARARVGAVPARHGLRRRAEARGPHCAVAVAVAVRGVA